MKKNFDVIIAGGGPAGLSAAIIAARNKCDTLLVESSKAFGYPIHDSGAIFSEAIKNFNVSKGVITNKIDGLTIVSPKGYVVSTKLGEGIGYILDRRELNRELAKIAANEGVEIKMPVKAVSPILSNGFVAGLQTKELIGGDNIEFNSKLVIDATGVNAVIAKAVGIHPGMSNIRWAIGAQYEMTNVELDNPNFIELYFGSQIAPSGYGWIIPKGDGVANVGVGITPISNERINPFKYLSRFIKEYPVTSKKLKNAQPLEYHVGILPIGPMFDQIVSDGLMIVGDAACQVSPHLGEGIRFVMKAGEIAGEVAVDAINKNNTSKNNLTQYEKQVKKEIYPNYRLLYKIHEYACSKDDESWERTIKHIENLIESNSGKKLIIKTVRGDISKWDFLTNTPILAFKGIKKILGHKWV